VVLYHFCEPFHEHCLVKQVLGSLDIVPVLLLDIEWLAVSIYADLQVLPISGVHSCRGDSVFKHLEAVIDGIQSIVIGARDVGFEASLTKFVAWNRLFYRCRDLEINQIRIYGYISDFKVQNDVESGELDLRSKCFPSIKDSEHQFWHFNVGRVHVSLPHLPVKRLRRQFWRHSMSEGKIDCLKAAPYCVRVAEWWSDRIFSLLMLFGLSLNASFLLFDPICKLVENFLW